MKHFSAGNVACWIAYLLVMIGVVWGMFLVRKWTMSTFDTPAARAEWQQWRDEATQQAQGKGPVKRREPKSVEHPAPRLMRDYFVVCTVMLVVLVSALFATFAYLLRGALRQTPAP